MLMNAEWNEAEAKIALGLLQQAAGATPTTEQQQLLQLVSTKLRQVEPAEGQLADIAGPARQSTFELLLLMFCLSGELTVAALATLDALDRQLLRKTGWPAILRHGQKGRGKLATLALGRRAPDGKALMRAVWRRSGVVGLVGALLSSVGRGPADPALAQRYQNLQSSRPDSLGAAFHRHMRSRKLPLPGEKGSLPELAMHHDLMHVLTGFDTDARGEARLAGVYAGMADRHRVDGGDAFTFVVVGLMTFHLGYDVGPSFVGPRRGAVDPAELLSLVELGSRVPFSVFTQWAFEDDLERPLAEVRARFGFSPDGALAAPP